MAIAITHKVDSKGRVLVPTKIMELVNIKPGDEVCYEVTKANAIVIRKVKK